MKRFENGQMSESDGPPLEHDEWTEQQNKAHAADAWAKESRTAAAKARASANRTSAADDDDDDGDEEPTFAGRPLSEYDDTPDDKLAEIDGIGDKTAEKIVAARRDRDQAK